MEHENANRVFLLNRDGKPLMPVLSKKGQAASEKRQGLDRKSTRLNSSHVKRSRMPSSA